MGEHLIAAEPSPVRCFGVWCVVKVIEPLERNGDHKRMPLSLKKLYGRKLGASDGEIGHVQDFYFEDQRWALRYVVADTGSWLPGRLVLLSPCAFEHLEHGDGTLPVKLTRKQIEGSPAAELHKPISRRYEEAYHAYYEWPPYWTGGGLRGIGSFSVESLPKSQSHEEMNGDIQPIEEGDPHLRSTQAVSGYDLQTTDGELGQVTDFLVDDYVWMIRYLVGETGSWFSGKQIVMSPQHIERISYAEAKVFVNVTKETILQKPEYHLSAAVLADEPNVAR